MNIGHRLVPRAAGHGRSSAFTLIELLVVLGIVAVLAALLIPALKTVRQSAMGIICGSNQRQVGTFLLSYCAENEGRFPGSAHTGHGSVAWVDLLNSELLEDYTTKVSRWGSTDLGDLGCPSFRPMAQYARGWGMNAYATGGLYDAGTNSSKYGRVFDPPSTRSAEYSTWTLYILGADARRFSVPATKALMADVAGGGSELVWDTGYIAARHGSGGLSGNVLFMDGHQEAVGFSRLAVDVKLLP